MSITNQLGPAASCDTSGQDRIKARQAHEKLKKYEKEKVSSNREPTREQTEMPQEVSAQAEEDQWLGSLGKMDTDCDKPFLNMGIEDYIKLLDWTGRQLKEGKKGRIPSDLAPILEQLPHDA